MAETPTGPHGEPTEPAAPAGRDALLHFGALAPGVTFAGRYRIDGSLGGGGSAEVFRAHDLLAGADVALKVMYPRTGPAAAPRVQRELAVARRLAHPGIVRIHDIGEAGGLQYLVMELLEGETLKARLARAGRLPAAAAARILRGLLEALAGAHAVGAVHRDVKPANIFLRRLPDGAERVVLVDLGLARAPEDASLTVTGQFVGTPEYVAPEQARGESELGPPVDLYAAGVVAWEMLSGAPPFAGETAAGVLHAHATRPLPPLRRALRGVPRTLRDLVAWLLEKRPGDRPASAARAMEFLDRRGRRLSFAWWKTGRRAALARATATGLLALVAGVLFVPHDVRPGARALEVYSLAGLRVRSIAVTWPIGGAVPAGARRIWPTAWIAWQGGRAGYPVAPRATDSSLFRVDLLSGTIAPLPFDPESLRGTDPLPAVGHFDRSYYCEGLTPLGAHDAWGRPLYVATYTHSFGEPSAVIVLSDTGRVHALCPTDGYVSPTVAVLRHEGESSRFADVIFAASEPALGQGRSVIDLRIVLTATVPMRFSLAGYSDERYEFTDRPRYILRASSLLVTSLTLDGRVAELQSRDDPVLRFDAVTGIPLEASARGGLSEQDWAARRTRIAAELELASREAGSAGPAAAASRLEAVAAPLAPGEVERAALLHRAATFRLRAQQYGAALADVHLIQVAPTLQTSDMLLATYAHMLRADWAAIEAIASRPTLRAGQWFPRLYAPLLAALLLNRPGDAARLLPSLDPGKVANLGAAYLRHAIVALHDGRARDALALLAASPVRDVDRRAAFLRALAWVETPGPDVSVAERDLAMSEPSRGDGLPLPFVPLKACLAAIAGKPVPGSDELERALEAARGEAETVVEARYFQAWGEALAARAYRERGDEPGFTRHREQARRIAGNAPFLALLLDAPGRVKTP